jgi:hypothetical protein
LSDRKIYYLQNYHIVLNVHFNENKSHQTFLHYNPVFMPVIEGKIGQYSRIVHIPRLGYPLGHKTRENSL